MLRKVGIVLFPGFSTIDLGAITVLELANRQHGGPFYELTILSDRDGMVSSAAGAMVHARAFGPGAYDTLLVFGTFQPLSNAPAIINMLRNAATAARRTATVCSGLLLMGATGLLDGHRVTTHWSRAADLQAMYPTLKVEAEHIFIRNDKHWTCAGMTATLDLILAMIESDLGTNIAWSVARMLVMYNWRSGTQAQASPLLDLKPKSDRIRSVLDYVRQNIRQSLTVDRLADHAGMSRRHFTRMFKIETGRSPAKAIEAIRADAARVFLPSITLSLETIARETGFNSAEQMRQAFVRLYGQTPQTLRQDARRDL
jgi:transcriptional regulator GlxA family with amidase domain